MENKSFLEFINNTPNAYCCIKNLKEILNQNGFKELYEYNMWDKKLSDGNYYITRNDSSLIAFKIMSKSKGFNITMSHSDNPSFSIKTNPEILENGYLKLNTYPYPKGAFIYSSWLDRPLSLAGRVITKKDDILTKNIINIDKDLLIIPSQAMHINLSVNTENKLNEQVDMLPIMSLKNIKLKDIIEEELNSKNICFDEIKDYELYLYNRDKARYVGYDNEFISSPRLDDLASLYPALESFIDSNSDEVTNVFCVFNNEEIGSLTMQGADSTFLSDTLFYIASNIDKNIHSMLANSFIVSADNAHAVHPNAAFKSDYTNTIYLGKGIAIKHHINYTTDSISSSLFKEVCERANAKYQDFATRSDMTSGSTLGGISTSHVSVSSVDIGIPQLSMHSANELIAKSDINEMYKALKEFYSSEFIRDKDSIKIKRYIK